MPAPVNQDWEELRFEAEAFATLIIARLRSWSYGAAAFSPTSPVSEKAGAEGIRTPDLLIANETLYQLSYDPARAAKNNNTDRARQLLGASERNGPLPRAAGALASGPAEGGAESGLILMRRLSLSKNTLPSFSAYKVQSRPVPTLTPAWNLVPHCRTRMLPAVTDSPPNRLTPRRLLTLSRPLRTLP